VDFHQLVFFGLKRSLAQIAIPPESGLRLNVGCGASRIIGTIPVDHHSNEDPNVVVWDADTEDMPFTAGSVAEIHCHHFLEHCANPIEVLKEFQRVLCPGGVVNITVPHYSSQLAIEDLDHKHQFCEETWKTLFKNSYYSKNHQGWQFTIGFNLIVGVAERNLCVLTQLIKE
jgi:SAM-dependent methyltransferase